jgi:hypothetical protein
MDHLLLVRLRLNRCTAVGALCALAVAPPVAAQRAARPFPGFAPALAAQWSADAPDRAAVRFGHPDDYRWEGLLVGGVVLGVTSAVVGASLCAQDDSADGSCFYPTVLVTVAGAGAGAMVGVLIGGLIPKAPADATR